MNKLLLIISSIVLLAYNEGYTTSQNNNIFHHQTIDKETYMKNVSQVFNKISNMCNEFAETSFILNKSFPHYYEISDIVKNTKANTHNCLIYSYDPSNMISFYDNTINELQEILNDTDESSTSGTNLTDTNLTDTNESAISSINLTDTNNNVTENDIINMTIEECKSLIQLNKQLLQLMNYRNEHYFFNKK